MPHGVRGIGINGPVSAEPPFTDHKAHIKRPRNTLHQVQISPAHWYRGGSIPSFNAMGDVGGFTPTGGYQNLTTVDRPQQTGLPVFSGFDPYTATLPLYIDVRSTNNAGTNVHFGGGVVEDIFALIEWFAGVGVSVKGVPALKSQTPANVSQVGPIEARIQTIDNHGNITHVIPPVHQRKLWLISDPQWGDRVRDTDGKLVSAKVTLTLTQSVVSEEAGNVTARFGGKREWHRYRVANPSVNTVMAIVQRHMHVRKAFWHSTAQGIMNFSKNDHLKLRTVHQKISPVRDGAIHSPREIWIPTAPINP